MKEPRVVYASHGNNKAMGYKFRVRIEKRSRHKWMGFGEKYFQYRWVLENYFMAWEDYGSVGYWKNSKEEAIYGGNSKLNSIETPPKGDYI